MTTLLHNHSFATEHVPLRAQLTCPTMFPDSLGNACDRPQLPMDLSLLCAECTWLTVLPDSCGSTYCGHSQLLNQLCARCTFIDSFRGSASLHPLCLSSPVDVSAEVYILHRNINRATSAASHSAQPTLGCLTRHSPPSAASLGTAHPRLPHSAQPTLGCLTRHSPPSAASLGTAHPRLPHSAQPTLSCLTLGTAHPRLPHSLGHSNVLTRSATATFSLARPQQRSHSLGHSNVLTCSATATFSLARPQQRSHLLGHSNSVSCSVQALCTDYRQDILIHLASSTVNGLARLTCSLSSFNTQRPSQATEAPTVSSHRGSHSIVSSLGPTMTLNDRLAFSTINNRLRSSSTFNDCFWLSSAILTGRKSCVPRLTWTGCLGSLFLACFACDHFLEHHHATFLVSLTLFTGGGVL